MGSLFDQRDSDDEDLDPVQLLRKRNDDFLRKHPGAADRTPPRRLRQPGRPSKRSIALSAINSVRLFRRKRREMPIAWTRKLFFYFHSWGRGNALGNGCSKEQQNPSSDSRPISVSFATQSFDEDILPRPAQHSTDQTPVADTSQSQKTVPNMQASEKQESDGSIHPLAGNFMMHSTRLCSAEGGQSEPTENKEGKEDKQSPAGQARCGHSRWG